MVFLTEFDVGHGSLVAADEVKLSFRATACTRSKCSSESGCFSHCRKATRWSATRWNTSAASGADGELYAGRTLPKRPRRSTTHRTNSPTDVGALEANKRTLCCRESRRTIISQGSSLIRHLCKRKRLCDTIATAIRRPSEPYLPPMPRASPASLEVLQTRCESKTTCNNAACKSISLSRCTRSHDYDFFPMSHWPTSPTETVSYALVRTSQLSKSSILIEVPQKQLGLQAAILLSIDSSSLNLLLPPQRNFLSLLSWHPCLSTLSTVSSASERCLDFH